MSFKYYALTLMLAVFLFQGCATARGFKEDVTNVVKGVSSSGGWIAKTDAWVKEHLW